MKNKPKHDCPHLTHGTYCARNPHGTCDKLEEEIEEVESGVIKRVFPEDQTMQIKDLMNLTTDRGMNYQGGLLIALGIASEIEGPWKQYLTSGVLVTMAIVAFCTRGSGLSHVEGQELKEDVIDEDGDKSDLSELLKRDRS